MIDTYTNELQRNNSEIESVLNILSQRTLTDEELEAVQKVTSSLEKQIKGRQKK